MIILMLQEEDIIKYNVIEEYNVNKLAQECGIRVNEFKLFESHTNKGYFGSKR